MKDNWLKDLQGKLADYEREAPDMLWEINVTHTYGHGENMWQLPFFYFSYAPHIF